MKVRKLKQLADHYYSEGKRLVAPLVGFPGVNLVGTSIKLAQQNCCEHMKVINSINECFHPDVSFPLMDLSVEANAIGRQAIFLPNESATVVIEHFDIEQLEIFKKINVEFDSRLLSYVDTIKLMNKQLPSSVMKGAYVTGPYTLAGLIIGAEQAATQSILNPDDFKTLCEFTIGIIKKYVELLIVNGAQLICVLEPSAVMLGPEQFEMFSARLVKKICEMCDSKNVSTVYHICGNSTHLVNKMCEAGVDALSLDSYEAGIDLPVIASNIPTDVVLIGNLNPIGSILNGKPEDVKKDVNELLESMDNIPNYILSTGCDLPQEIPIENIDAFMKAGRDYKIKTRKEFTTSVHA